MDCPVIFSTFIMYGSCFYLRFLCTLLQSIYEGTMLCAKAISFYMETAVAPSQNMIASCNVIIKLCQVVTSQYVGRLSPSVLCVGMNKHCTLGLLAIALSCSTTIFSHGSESEKSRGRDASNRTGFWCPDLCTCSSSARIVDCSARGLTRVPEVAASTTRL